MIAVVLAALLFAAIQPPADIGAYAEQGSPTEENTPAPTLEETSTPAPTLKETSTPAPTVGEETPAPTNEPTPTGSTPAPTIEPTPAPTIEPTPGNVLVLAPEVFGGSYQKLNKLNYLPGGMQIPALYQYHYTQLVATQGEEKISVASSGCGATALSMVVVYLTGNRNQTPYTIFRLAFIHGMYGTGLGHEGMSKLGEEHGILSQWIGRDKERIIAELNAGHPIIAHMGKGTFAPGGHYIVLRGVAEDGSIYVNDPNSAKRSRKTYSLDLIIDESKSEDPFMVCTLPVVPTPDPTQMLELDATPEPDAKTESPIDATDVTTAPEPTMTAEPAATPEPVPADKPS